MTDGASPPDFAPGDWVIVDGMAGYARVLSIDRRRRRAQVEFGGQQWVVAIGRLRRTGASPEPRIERPVTLTNVSPVQHEIDLHGMYVEDALEVVERGLDQAVVNHLDRFKIIHGHGTGRLRQAVRELLRRHPHVESFRFGEPQEGGLACTVVFLKKNSHR